MATKKSQKKKKVKVIKKRVKCKHCGKYFIVNVEVPLQDNKRRKQRIIAECKREAEWRARFDRPVDTRSRAEKERERQQEELERREWSDKYGGGYL